MRELPGSGGSHFLFAEKLREGCESQKKRVSLHRFCNRWQENEWLVMLQGFM